MKYLIPYIACAVFLVLHGSLYGQQLAENQRPGWVFTRFEFALSSIGSTPEQMALSDIAGRMKHAADIKNEIFESNAEAVHRLTYQMMDVRFYAVRPDRPRHEWMAGFANARLGASTWFNDPSNEKTYRLGHNVQFFSVQTGWRYRTAPAGRFSWFGGVVLNTGRSVGAKTTLLETALPDASSGLTGDPIDYRFFGKQAGFFQAALQGGFYFQVFGRAGLSLQFQPGRMVSTIDGTRYSGRATWARWSLFVKLL